MNLEARRLSKHSMILCASLLLLVGLFGLAIIETRSCRRLNCVLENDLRSTQCTEAIQIATVDATRLLSDSGELAIERVQVSRDRVMATLSIELNGRFWNETDQNIYIFAGRPS